MRNERWEMGIPREEWRMLIGWMMGRKGGEVEVKVEVKMDSAVCSRRMHGICRLLQRTEDLKRVSNVDDVNVEEESVVRTIAVMIIVMIIV